MPEPGGALTSEAVRQLEPALHAYARRAVSDRELAKDLVQETLLAAFERIDKFEGRSSLKGWLIGILSHKVIDHYRKRRPGALEIPDDRATDDALLAHPTAAAVETALDARRAVRTLERALPLLPELERMSVLLVDVEGIERDEAQRLLGVSDVHLRVLLHRARNRLRRTLEDAALPPRT